MTGSDSKINYDSINGLISYIGEWAKNKGWNMPRTFGDDIALMHSELSEAYEEYRNHHEIGDIYYNTDNQNHLKPEGIPIEIADLVIRIFHWCYINNIDLPEYIRIKMTYNEKREHRHGGKRT